MKMDELMGIIYEFSFSTGFYGRLFRDLQELKENDEEAFEELKEEWESKNFTTSLDFIMYLECGE